VLGSSVNAYVALLQVMNDAVVRVGSLGYVRLGRGFLAYVGSANIRRPYLRVLRHCRKRKRVRWHIDYITVRGDVRVWGALILSGVTEEEVYNALLGIKGVEPYVKGLGCSDSVSHVTHVFQVGCSGWVECINYLVKQLMHALRPVLVELVVC